MIRRRKSQLPSKIQELILLISVHKPLTYVFNSLREAHNFKKSVRRFLNSQPKCPLAYDDIIVSTGSTPCEVIIIRQVNVLLDQSIKQEQIREAELHRVGIITQNRFDESIEKHIRQNKQYEKLVDSTQWKDVKTPMREELAPALAELKRLREAYKIEQEKVLTGGKDELHGSKDISLMQEVTPESDDCPPDGTTPDPFCTDPLYK